MSPFTSPHSPLIQDDPVRVIAAPPSGAIDAEAPPPLPPRNIGNDSPKLNVSLGETRFIVFIMFVLFCFALIHQVKDALDQSMDTGLWLWAFLQ
jgi:hypothetical protein